MKKIKWVILLIVIIQVPVLILFTEIVSYENRYIVLAASSSIILIYTLLRHHSFYELGFRIDNIKASLKENTIFSISIVAILLLLYKINLIREPTIPEWDLFFMFYILISSPVQEFIFRSLFIKELKMINLSKPLIIIVSAINYSLLHIFYHDWLTFLSSFCVGLCFGWIYIRNENIFGLSLSHAVIGAISIYVGLI